MTTTTIIIMTILEKFRETTKFMMAALCGFYPRVFTRRTTIHPSAKQLPITVVIVDLT